MNCNNITRRNSRKRTRKQFETSGPFETNESALRISKDEYELINNSGHGSCLIKSILKGFGHNQQFIDLTHESIRKLIVCHIRKNVDQNIFKTTDGFTTIKDWIPNTIYGSLRRYCKEMIKPETYCTSLETEIAAQNIFQCNILIFRNEVNNTNGKYYSLYQCYLLDPNGYNIDNFKNLMSNDDANDTTILLHFHNQHYQTLRKKTQRNVVTAGSRKNDAMLSLSMYTPYHNHYPYHPQQQHHAPLHVHQDEGNNKYECNANWKTMNAYFVICQAKYEFQQQSDIKTFSSWLKKYHQNPPNVIETNRLLQRAKYLYEHNMNIKKSQLDLKFATWKRLSVSKRILAKDMLSNITDWQIPQDFKETLLID